MTTVKKSRIAWFVSSWKGRSFIAGMVVILGCWAWWFNEHRTETIQQAISPAYWIARWEGNDLYYPQTAYLAHGNRALREVALTFDDGPHPESLPSILATLNKNHIHATFFDVGENMAKWPWLVKETLADGNVVGDHSSTHLRFPKLSHLELHHEINDADITFCRITGGHMYLLRPPGVDISRSVQKTIKSEGYITVGYTDASRDYDLKVSPTFIADRTLDRVDNGAIILLHDYPGTARALPEIVRELKERGYSMVTIPQMIAHLPLKARTPAMDFLEAQQDPTIASPFVSGSATPEQAASR